MNGLSVFVAVSALLFCGAQQIRSQASDIPNSMTHDHSSKAIEVSDREVWRHRLGYHKPIRTDKFGHLGYLGGIGLDLTVGTDGIVISANATEGPKEFYAEATTRSQTWKYKPFLRRGRSIVALIHERISILPAEQLPTTHVPFPKVDDLNAVVMTLERTGCYGTCPSYKVEIRGDGSVRYTGRFFVGASGEHHGQIPQSSILQLVEAFRSADYFSLEDKYVGGMTDNPTYITSIAVGATRKSVVDYVGAYAGMPDAVSELEEIIDQIVGTEKWVRR